MSQQPDIVPIICHRCHTGGKLPPVSLTPVANLPPVSTTLGKLVVKFAAGVADTGPNGLLWGWGETESWKKPEAKNLVTLSL